MLVVIAIIILAFLPALILPSEELKQDTNAASFVRTLRQQYYQQHADDRANSSSTPSGQDLSLSNLLDSGPKPPSKAAAHSDCSDDSSGAAEPPRPSPRHASAHKPTTAMPPFLRTALGAT